MHRSLTLQSLSQIRHGFFGRKGGVSEGHYASLNTGYGSGDDIEKVRENRRTVCEKLGSSAELLTCFQIHSAEVVRVSAPWEWKNSPQADALVTNVPGIPLGVLTADCLPVLFADKAGGVVGAAHAGWKGAFSGVLEATIREMQALGAQDIVAAIGPAIAQASYEVGPEFYERFIAHAAANAAFFKASASDGHYLFDLPAYAKGRLLAAGIAEVEILGYDTCALEDEFFSYRRATLRKESVYGRQVAAIMLEKI